MCSLSPPPNAKHMHACTPPVCTQKHSVPSLVAGLASAGVISLCSYASLQQYHAGKTCKPATAVSLVVAAGLTYMMYQRYSSTGKVMPAGMVAGISGTMTGVCVVVVGWWRGKEAGRGVLQTHTVFNKQTREGPAVVVDKSCQRCTTGPVSCVFAYDVGVCSGVGLGRSRSNGNNASRGLSSSLEGGTVCDAIQILGFGGSSCGLSCYSLSPAGSSQHWVSNFIIF